MVSVPTISVIVAVRNAAGVLADTLDSLVRQDERDFEVILVDGASTDNTMQVAERYAGLIARSLSEPDDGIADAWNKGIRMATGRWVTFLNAGDYLHPRHFSRARPQLDAAAANSILFCDVLKFKPGGPVSNVISGRAPSVRGIKRGGVGFGHPGSFTPLAAFTAVGGFDTRLKIAIDTDFLLRCVKAQYQFQKFPSVAYMAEGGVSDRHFGRAMREYYGVVERLGLVSAREAGFYGALLPQLRRGLHLARKVLFGPLRFAKHALIASLNLAGAVLPLHSLRRLYFRLLGFKLGQGASIGMGVQFYQLGKITLGPRSIVNRGCLLDNRAPITVGHDVSIARDVRIFTAGHDTDSPFFEMVSAPVTIGDHAVLFAGAVIMPGVTIGRGAVVYPGSVVTRDVAPMSVVGGVPARTLRSRAAEPLYQLHYPYPLAM